MRLKIYLYIDVGKKGSEVKGKVAKKKKKLIY